MLSSSYWYKVLCPLLKGLGYGLVSVGVGLSLLILSHGLKVDCFFLAGTLVGLGMMAISISTPPEGHENDISPLWVSWASTGRRIG